MALFVAHASDRRKVFSIKTLKVKPDQLRAENSDGYLPLHTAVIGGNLAIVKHMIENLNADVYAKNQAGISPIQLAKMHNLEDIIDYLQNNIL